MTQLAAPGYYIILSSMGGIEHGVHLRSRHPHRVADPSPISNGYRSFILISSSDLEPGTTIGSVHVRYGNPSNLQTQVYTKTGAYLLPAHEGGHPISASIVEAFSKRNKNIVVTHHQTKT